MTNQIDTITSMIKLSQISIRVSDELKDSISEVAYQKGMNLTALVLIALAGAYPELKDIVDKERRR